MNRIHKLFAGRKKNILSIFYTAGFPALDDTISIAHELEKAGADVIEIGIPFSDPVADGPVIQESNRIALENGMTVKILLSQVREIRKQVSLPIILMGYLNPVYQYGFAAFCKDAAAAGADGLILPDMPFDEYVNEYKDHVESSGLVNVFLVSPTTSENRIRAIDGVSEGFVYAVSSTSTTGVKGEFSDDQISYFKRLKEMKLDNPLLIGFGISGRETFETACRFASGAIIGSAFIRQLEKDKKSIAQFIKAIFPAEVADEGR